MENLGDKPLSRLVSIGEAAQIKGVSIDTLRQLEKEGKISAVRTSGGHRRYELSDLIPYSDENKKTIVYCRVSSHDQKADLVLQSLVLAAYCESHSRAYEIIQDGVGAELQKEGTLRSLIEYILDEQVDRLIVTHLDRLLRFGSELIFALCEHFGVEVLRHEPQGRLIF